MTFLVKPIRPGKPSARELRMMLHRVLEAEGRAHVKELKKTVKTWRRKVGFGYDVDVSRSEASVISGPVSGNVQVWTWLNEGTKGPYPITPHGNYPLRFRVGGKPKTKPWRLGSTAGKPGSQWRTARRVMHPGIQAREWTKTLASKRKKPFAKNVNSAIKRGTAMLYKK